jgi:succinoglycan biosynthesis transport protein ExoP
MDPLKVTPAPESKLHFLDYWRIIRIRKTVILAVFLLVVLTATLVTFILPPTYSSTARIKIERDQTDISGFTTPQNPMGSYYDPYFFLTESEVIQSEAVLGKVITNLDLNVKFGAKYQGGMAMKTPESLKILKGAITLKGVRNTSLVDITVFNESATDAAEWANSIADSYKTYRLDQKTLMSQRGIETLEKEMKRMDTNVVAAKELVDRLRKELNVSDMAASESAPTPLITTETFRRYHELKIESKVEYDRLKTLLDMFKKLDMETLAQTVPTAASDNLLSNLLESKNLAEQQLLVKEKDYGPEHLDVIKARAQLEDIKSKIDARLRGILVGLEAKVTSLKTGLDGLDAEVEEARSTDIRMASETRPYWEAKKKLAEVTAIRQMVDMKILSEKIDMALPKSGAVMVLDRAVPDIKPVKPKKTVNIALGVIIGLVVGIGLAFFIEYLDTSVKTIDDVERALQSPVLGVIPQNVGLLIDESVESPHAEAYRVLRTNILFSRKDDKLNTIAVVSAGAGEGKSTTVFNLATVFAQNGQRVVIVDSDLRRPTLHKMVKVTNNLGLTNYLLKQNTLDEVIQTSPVPTLDFMASGKLPSSSLGILSSTQMRELIGELKKRYDFVFFDSPPIMGVSDASILASAVDMTIQVIQYRRYPQPMNIRAKNMIEKVGGNLVGIVLNNINMSQDESYYYYSGYYHDYYYSGREDSSGKGSSGKGKSGEKSKEKEKEKLDIKQKF